MNQSPDEPFKNIFVQNSSQSDHHTFLFLYVLLHFQSLRHILVYRCNVARKQAYSFDITVYKTTKRKNILPNYGISPYEYTIDRISTGNGSWFTFCRKLFNHFPAFSRQSSWPTLQAAFNINTRNSLETNGKTRFS